MSINNFFSGKRFFRLLQHEFYINKKPYLWTLVGIILILFTINYIFLLSYKWRPKGFIIDNYFFPFLLSSTVMFFLVGTAFSEFSNEIKTQNFLMLPASMFEKFLSQFVSRFLVFIPLTVFLFWTTTRLAKLALPVENSVWQMQSLNYDNLPLNHEIKNSYYANTTQAEINYQSSQVPDFDFGLLFGGRTKIDFVLLLIWCFAFVSLFVVFAGKVYFKRFGFVKSLVVLGGILTCSVIATKFFNEYLISKVGLNAWQYAYQNYFIATVFRMSNGSKAHFELFILWIVLSIGLLLGFSYFKLKEKEV